MDKNTAIIAMMGIASSTAIMITLITAWSRRRAGVLPSGVGAPELERISAQLSELQRQLDATQVEIERLGEGQRFTTKLLTEKAAAGSQLHE